jgi:hypothetical protein
MNKQNIKQSRDRVFCVLAVVGALTVGALFALPSAQAGITWTPANPMNKARSFFMAVELLNGNVLVAGGFDGSIANFIFADAEIYNWQTGTWTPIASMNTARAASVGLRLEDGRVMVIGGADENFNFLASAEIYDPRNNTWSLTAPMNEAHFEDFTAVLLPGRKVLVAGGFGPTAALNSAEIYDEATGTWTPTGSMNVARGEFPTVVLHDGRVLAVGGCGGVCESAQDGIAAAEIYDPATGIWTLTGSMSTARSDLAAVGLQDGRVLAAGGHTGDEELPRYASAEIFDPQRGQWTPTGDMTIGRSEAEYASVLLPDGRVLVPGGHTAFQTPVSSADLYDPRTGTWTAAGFMSVVRAGHSSIMLRDNRGVLVMGGLGADDNTATASADIFRTD